MDVNLNDLFISLFLAYLIGSLSFSIIAGKILRGIDIREHGSGNAGATNTLRVLGKKAGYTVLLLDALKGAAAVGCAYLITDGSSLIMILAGIVAIFGHNWPLYHSFKGGKGVATTLGVVASLVFLPTLVAFIISFIVLKWKRYVSLASIVFAVNVPVFTFLLERDMIYIVFTSIMALLVIIRHKSNIVRLYNGEENKFGE